MYIPKRFRKNFKYGTGKYILHNNCCISIASKNCGIRDGRINTKDIS